MKTLKSGSNVYAIWPSLNHTWRHLRKKHKKSYKTFVPFFFSFTKKHAFATYINAFHEAFFSYQTFLFSFCLLFLCANSNAHLSSAAICWSSYRFSPQVASYMIIPSLASTLNKSAARWRCRISWMRSPVGIDAVSPGYLIPTPHPPLPTAWSFNSTIARESCTGQSDSACHCITREKSDNPLALRTQ